MLLQVMNSIEDIVEKYTSKKGQDYRFINDHNLNPVCQVETDEESFECILAEIDEVLPAGIIFTHQQYDDGYEITFRKVDTMNKYVKQSILLNAAIENEFGPLDWVDITVHEEDGTGSISFTGPSRKECINEDGEYDRICFIARQDGFFSKMHKIKNMIKNCGMTADLIKFEADCEFSYSEATININFEGGEL